jgi:arylsulfatase A-like enzyme
MKKLFRTIGWIVLVPMVLCLAAGCSGRPVAQGPNIIVLLVDAMRADHLGCYGYGRNTSPEMDTLAREGVVFKNAYSPSSWTLPSTASLLTSLYPREHGATDTTKAIARKAVGLAERLHKAGYDTAAFSANYSLVTAERGFDRGCDHFELLVKEGSEVSAEELNRTRKLLDFARKITAVDAEELNAAALKWLDGRKETSRPVFMYLHYMESHSPYEAPEPFRTVFDPDYTGEVDGTNVEGAVFRDEFELTERDEEHVTALYDGEIAYADKQLGILMDELDSRGLLEDALVIITADHGEELFDHGKISHGRTLYEEVIRVPLIMWQKQFEHPGTTVDAYASLIDIVPTVLSVCGIERKGALRGTPLLPPGDSVGSDTVWAEVDEDLLFRAHKRALIWDNWKLITSPDGSELYDIAGDPHELNDLAGSKPELAATLSAKQDDFYKQLKRGKAPVVELDDEARRKLRSLGYVARGERSSNDDRE